jgi:hypothetical protein
MKCNYHAFNYNNSLLMAVPAVHHHTAFAKQIHRICCDPKQRPDAIAVELGHSLVAELERYLRELQQGTPEKKILPCMLGLMKRNRYIHADQAEKALLLQDFHRSQLFNLPDDLLADRLNFSKWSTLFISPADSIIEAVRCAIELDIQLYGVDLCDFAHTKMDRYSIEDPQTAHTNVLEYGNRVMKYCDAGRDPHIDFNRETFMASGLKHCLSKHRKVLFTCGMAHWKSIVSLLTDDRVIPFPVHEIQEETEFRRVIVHPSLAASVMEIIPQITFDYEKRRYPVTGTKKKSPSIKPEIEVRNCLDSVYKLYTSKSESGVLKKSDSVEWNNISIYEQFMFQFAAIRQRKIQDFATMLSSAEVMMNDNFCRLLTQKIMEVNPTWASSKDYPDLPVMEPTANNLNDSQERLLNRKVRITPGNQGKIAGEKEFYTTIPNPYETDIPDINKYWIWLQKKKKDNPSERRFGNPWLWPPGESLIYGIAFKAAEIALLNQKHLKYSSAFDGSLEGGIDVKATIRSIIRGEQKIYVSKLVSGLEQTIIDGINPDPFVLIFPESSDITSGKWNFFTAGSELEKFVSNPELYNRVTTEKGHVIVSSISLDHKVATPEHLKPLSADITKTHGTVMFGNPCINARQSACWIESAKYQCCPILFEHGMSSLLAYYQHRFNLNINLTDWHESLIRMAIPYAKRMVTILAPDSFRIPVKARMEAGRKRIMLNLVGYSNFPEAQLEEARHRISLPSLDRSGIHFPPEAEYLIGQTKETYFEMLPPAMRKQVGYAEPNSN